jgi:hypothetical protein
MKIACPLRRAKGRCIASHHRRKGLALNGIRATALAKDSNYNRVVRLSESQEAQPSPPSKGSALGITFIDGYGHSVFLPLPSGVSFDVYFLM